MAINGSFTLIYLLLMPMTSGLTLLKYVCPSGKIPYLEEETVRSCSQNRDCPVGYTCTESMICCGEPGQCPPHTTPHTDKHGRFTPCSSPVSASECETPALCMDTTQLSQKMCCTKIVYKCPVKGSVVPSATSPQTCSLSEWFSCPGRSQCMPSNVPAVNVCCQADVIYKSIPDVLPGLPLEKQISTNPCPKGWRTVINKVITCSPANPKTCPHLSSCMRTTTGNPKFACCILGTTSNSSQSSKISSKPPARRICPRYNSQPEVYNGALRRCSPTNSTCSKGFSCQISPRRFLLCCSISSTVRAQQPQVPYTCPGGQSAVVSQLGNNVFCNSPNQRDVCPLSALCQSASNSQSLFICCYTSSPSTQPTCPNGGTAQQSVGGQYTACDITNPRCNTGYSCMRAANDFSITLCCSTSPSTLPSCPAQQSLLLTNGNPYYCNPTVSTPCPTGYTCTQADGRVGTFICCSSTNSPQQCPSGTTPSQDALGNPIFCSPNNPTDCPGGSSCVQSPNNPSTFLCCRSTDAQSVCRNNLVPLLTPSGTLEMCTTPGVPCSNTAYSCMFSTTVAQYVCCGQEQSAAICADGREPFEQVPGQTYSCNPLQMPNGCPVGYDCAQSSILGTYVCCRTGMIVTTTASPSMTQCPTGWNPYRNEVTGEHRTCSNPFDMTCPTGFSCTPSAVSSSQFVCCRIASSLRCVSGVAFILNGQPRLCSRQRLNQCPPSYSCQQSSAPSVTICCSSLSRDPLSMCPDGSLPVLNGLTVHLCSGDVGSCPEGYSCITSVSGANICCRTSVSGGSSLLGLSRRPHEVKKNQKPVGMVCGRAAAPLLINNRAVECDTNNGTCPSPHRCTITRVGSICCREVYSPFCPPNRAIFLSSDRKPFFCDDSGYLCPVGYQCIHSTPLDRFVCCSQPRERNINEIQTDPLLAVEDASVYERHLLNNEP